MLFLTTKNLDKLEDILKSLVKSQRERKSSLRKGTWGRVSTTLPKLNKDIENVRVKIRYLEYTIRAIKRSIVKVPNSKYAYVEAELARDKEYFDNNMFSKEIINYMKFVNSLSQIDIPVIYLSTLREGARFTLDMDKADIGFPYLLMPNEISRDLEEHNDKKYLEISNELFIFVGELDDGYYYVENITNTLE